MSFSVIRSDGKYFPIEAKNIMSQDKIDFIESFNGESCIYDLTARPSGMFVGQILWEHDDDCLSGIKLTQQENAPNCNCFAKCHGIVPILN